VIGYIGAVFHSRPIPAFRREEQKADRALIELLLFLMDTRRRLKTTSFGNLD
jgi:hypothetical protein